MSKTKKIGDIEVEQLEPEVPHCSYAPTIWLNREQYEALLTSGIDSKSISLSPYIGQGKVVWNAEKGLFEPNRAYKDMFTTFTGVKRWEN